MASARAFVEGILKKADVTIGGARPQDITVHDERLYNRVLRYGTLGMGESWTVGGTRPKSTLSSPPCSVPDSTKKSR